MAKNIHRYFAHVSSDKLGKFLDTTDHINKEDIKKELKNLDCEICT